MVRRVMCLRTPAAWVCSITQCSNGCSERRKEVLSARRNRADRGWTNDRKWTPESRKSQRRMRRRAQRRRTVAELAEVVDAPAHHAAGATARAAVRAAQADTDRVLNAERR